MIKEAPSLGRILAMVVFTLSVFALLMFLWLAFGGPIPLKPQGYRLKAAFPEAATLAVEADVRMAGVNVGKVKSKELERRTARTLVELELKPHFAPIPRNTRAILRQKTLLGETYIELAPGDTRSGDLQDGGRLANAQIEDTVQLDEIFNAFDEPTRQAYRNWVDQLAKAIKGGRAEDLNDAFGNLEGFAVDGATLLETLDEQEVALRRVIKNTGVVFGAINEREGALRELIVNSNNTFEATASRDDALAETFQIFPTFLDESKATLARLEVFARDTRPLVNDLKGPADDLGPTVRDLGDLAPDLESLFRDLNPLIRAGNRGLPDLERVVREAEPVFETAHVFFPELNPILSMFNFYQARIAGFISNAAPDIEGDFGGQRYQVNAAIIEPRSFDRHTTRPSWDRGTAYLQPNGLSRTLALGVYESFSCSQAGGERRNPNDAVDAPGPLKGSQKRPPCFLSTPSLYDGDIYNFPQRGRAPNEPAPQGPEGVVPADPDR